jgi:hypothetical protein
MDEPAAPRTSSAIGIVVVVAGLVLLVAAFQPWAESDAVQLRATVSGLSAWPGMIALLAGIALLALGALGVYGRARRRTLTRASLAAGALVVLAALIAVASVESMFRSHILGELAKVSRAVSRDNQLVSGVGGLGIGVGSGAYLAIAGGLAAIAAGLIGLVAERKPTQD